MTTDRPKKRPLPPGWRWVRLGNSEIATIVMGQSPPGSTYTKEPTGLPFYQGAADFGELYPTPRVWCTAPIRVAEPGDVLLSVRAPVGPTNLVQERCCIGRGLVAIRPGELLLTYYLLSFLRHIQDELVKTGSGSTFGAISREQVEAIELPLPPLPEQRAIVARLKAQMAEVARLRMAAERQLGAVHALPKTLLNEVFGGFQPPTGSEPTGSDER